MSSISTSKNNKSQKNTVCSTNFSNLALNNQQQTAKLLADYKQIILELRAQNFDVIRFATYRTASKLRFIQKKLNLHLIDLWNLIETFRDNNLHTLDILNEIEFNKIESCIHNMYMQLNKRLAHSQHINVENQTQLLLAWLLNIYDKNRLSKIKIISFKVALTSLCDGKLVDKIKYIFTQISDKTKNSIIIQKFDMYLKESLAIPKSVFEEPSFSYNENISKSCFDLGQPIRLEDFLNVILSDYAPACFIWLNIFHRFTLVQSVVHPIPCNVCERTNFNGFRYKCQKCRKYQMCQDCFWRGRISHTHQLTHQMKEYTSYKSAAKQISNSLKKSLFCKPSKFNKTNINQKDHIKKTTNSTFENLKYDKNQYSINEKESNNQNYQDTNSLNQNIQINQNIKLNDSQNQTQKNCINNQILFNNNNKAHLINNFIPYKNDEIYSTISKFSQHDKNLPQSLDTILNKQISDPSFVKNGTEKNNVSNTENLDSNQNIFINFTTKKSYDSSTNADEHNLIADYCSRLSDFYIKNPHISQLAISNSPLTLPESSETNSNQNLIKAKENIRAKTLNSKNCNFILDDKEVFVNTVIAKQNSSKKSEKILSHNYKNNNTKKENEIKDDLNLISNSIIEKSPFKLQKNAIRSLSETNFRLKDDEEIHKITNSVNSKHRDLLNERLLVEKRKLVLKLEQQNKEIIKEIQKLKLKNLSNKSLEINDQLLNKNLIIKTKVKSPKDRENREKLPNKNFKSSIHNTTFCSSSTMINPSLIVELESLKQRKDQLENRMIILESSRDQLIERLTQLDTIYKPNSKNFLEQKSKKNSQFNKSEKNDQFFHSNIQTSLDTEIINSLNLSDLSIQTPNEFQKQLSLNQSLDKVPSKAFVPASIAMQMPSLFYNTNKRSFSNPSTPALNELHSNKIQGIKNNSLTPSVDSLISLVGLSSPDSISKSLRIGEDLLKKDLLIAADSVTNAMQSLVKELNFENTSFQINTSEDEDDETLLSFDTIEKNNLCDISGNIKKNTTSNGNFFSNYENKSSNSGSVVPLSYKQKNKLDFQQELMMLTDRNELDNYDISRAKLLMTNLKNKIEVNMIINEKDIKSEKEINLIKNDSNLLENAKVYNEEIDEVGDNLYECYLLNESVNNSELDKIIDFNNLSNQIKIFESKKECNPESNSDYLLLENNESDVSTNLVNNNEQADSWRRALEQRLIDNTNKSSNSYL